MQKILASKTVWLNIVVFIIALLALPEFVRVLPPSWLPYDILGGSAANLILRIFFTANPVTSFAGKFKD